MLEAGVVSGSMGAASQVKPHELKHGIPIPLDPGKRPPIASAAKKAGQKEYRCKVKAYGITVHRIAPQPVMTTGGAIEMPEQLVRIDFKPTYNGYGSYILGSDRNGHVRYKVSREDGIVEMTADELREEWFDSIINDPIEAGRAHLRPGALWCAEDEVQLYLEAQVKVALAALMVPGVLKAVGDAFRIDPSIGKTVALKQKAAPEKKAADVVTPPPAQEIKSESDVNDDARTSADNPTSNDVGGAQ